MMNDENYHDCYRVLGLSPGDASWEQVRRAYRSLIRRWHPDRIELDDPEHKLAEAHTKTINQAYHRLAGYYRQYGRLPLPEPGNDATDALDTDVDTGHDAPAPAPANSRSPPREHAAPRVRHRTYPRVVAFATLLGAVYVVTKFVSAPPENEPLDRAAATGAAALARNEPTRPPKSTFGIGSTLGEVYSAQGIPTQTGDDVWTYGASKVYFRNGKVLSWDNHPDYPLNVQLYGRERGYEPMTIGIGSTKSQVRAMLGPPTRVERGTWFYGESRIHFNGDYVIALDEAPQSPLPGRRQ